MRISPFLLIILIISCQSEEKVSQNIDNKDLTSLFEKIDNYGDAPQDSLDMGFHPKGEWTPLNY